LCYSWSDANFSILFFLDPFLSFFPFSFSLFFCGDDDFLLAFVLIFFYAQARERQQREEQERLEREAAEAERKRKEEEEARDRAASEAAEKEAALARMRQEKALSLGAEPEKGPDVTQVKSLSVLLITFFL